MGHVLFLAFFFAQTLFLSFFIIILHWYDDLFQPVSVCVCLAERVSLFDIIDLQGVFLSKVWIYYALAITLCFFLRGLGGGGSYCVLVLMEIYESVCSI